MTTTKPSALLKNPQLLQTACFVDGRWINTNDRPTIAVHNPYDQSLIAFVPDLSADDIESAIGYAEEALPAWRCRSSDERAALLLRWADLIDANREDLAILMTLEQGKPLVQAQGEIDYGNSFIRFFAEEGKRIYGDTIASPHSNLRYLVLKQPVGVCAAITPWNFPNAMITRKVAPALAAGCTIIVKPASATPLSALALSYLARQAGIPDGVLQVITANADRASDMLCHSPIIKKLSFTGSTATGRLLMGKCASTVKKLSLELGGNAPFIIFADADIERAIDGLMACKHRNAGQVCTAANRIFVQRAIKDTFVQRYSEKTAKLTTGNGLHDPDIGPLINESAAKKAKALLQNAVNLGGQIILGGGSDLTHTACFSPTIIDDASDTMAMANDELFSPISAIYTFDSEEEVIFRANNTPYGLAAYFYSQDLGRSFRLMEQLDYGMIGQNTGLLSSAVVPFGGVKQSGFGREGSKYGIDDYLNLKYWCVDVG